MPTREAEVLQFLAQRRAEREEELAQYEDENATETEDDEADAEAPVMERFISSGAMLEMTNFSVNEFIAVWEIVKGPVEVEWYTGRGRKCAHRPKDVFFMVLETLKHGGLWDMNARLFGIKGPTFERMVIFFMSKITPLLWQVVEGWEKKYTMTRLLKDKKTFSTFRVALYATDVTFQNTNRPAGNHQESKCYFSNKHKLYGYKTEVSVLPNGIAAGCTVHHPGSVSDLTIFRKNISWRRVALSKTEAEIVEISDMGPLVQTFKGQWAILMDKGYQGAAEIARAITPKKKPKGGSLTNEEILNNVSIACDRSIVERYFGRQCVLWAVIGSKWRWEESNYDMFLICLCV